MKQDKSQMTIFSVIMYFSIILIALIGSASLLVTAGTHFRGVKRYGREADHSSPNTAEVKKNLTSTAISPYVFKA
jgi:hypothetical protein